METKRKALGTGLEQLFSNEVINFENFEKNTVAEAEKKSSVGEIKVSVGDNVTKGTVIATSGTTKLQTAKPQTLLFEVYYNGTLMNPLEFYEKYINDLK